MQGSNFAPELRELGLYPTKTAIDLVGELTLKCVPILSASPVVSILPSLAKEKGARP